MQGGASARVRDHDFGAQSVNERAARTVFGQMKADRRPGHRPAGLVGDLHGDRATAPRSGEVYGAFAFNYSNL